MKFKYNIIALSLLGTMAVSCDPLGDIYNDIDAQGSDVTKVKEEYVLTQADYESIAKAALADAGEDETNKALANRVKTDLALNSFATADKYIPTVLKSLYPSWGEGSMIGVTYNYLEGASGLEAKYDKSDLKVLKAADYTKVWGEGSPVRFLTSTVEAKLPELLATLYPDATENDLVVVEYQYAASDPVYTGKDLLLEDFETQTSGDDIKGWTQIQTKGKVAWESKLNAGNLFAQCSAYGYADGEVDSWLVSKPVNVTAADFYLTFDLTYGFHNADVLSVLISTDFDGVDVEKATWTDVTTQFPDIDKVEKKNGYGKTSNVGNLPLSAYNGQKIYVAFRYSGEGPDTETTTVQIDNIVVSDVQWTSKPKTELKSPLYAYVEGNWSTYENSDLIYLSKEDYDSMGDPGKNDNFSSSINPDDYLPRFLASKLPYAQTGDEQAVLYRYYESSVTTTKVRVYTFDEGWLVKNNIVTISKENYSFAGGKWMFTPIVPVVMEANDYQILQDWVEENHPGYIDAKYQNSEYWFGGSVYYKNFNTNLVTRRTNDPEKVLEGMSDEDAEAYLTSMIAEGMLLLLETRFPNAEAQQNGADVYYEVSSEVYDGGRYTYVFKFKSLGGGQFELAGEPEISAK